MDDCDFGLNAANIKILKKVNDTVTKSNKCSQCDFASYWPFNFKTHLKTHSGEQASKCNQCDFVSVLAQSLSRQLKTHSGEKYQKCDPCDFPSGQADIIKM